MEHHHGDVTPRPSTDSPGIPYSKLQEKSAGFSIDFPMKIIVPVNVPSNLSSENCEFEATPKMMVYFRENPDENLDAYPRGTPASIWATVLTTVTTHSWPKQPSMNHIR